MTRASTSDASCDPVGKQRVRERTSAARGSARASRTYASPIAACSRSRSLPSASTARYRRSASEKWFPHRSTRAAPNRACTALVETARRDVVVDPRAASSAFAQDSASARSSFVSHDCRIRREVVGEEPRCLTRRIRPQVLPPEPRQQREAAARVDHDGALVRVDRCARLRVARRDVARAHERVGACTGVRLCARVARDAPSDTERKRVRR